MKILENQHFNPNLHKTEQVWQLSTATIDFLSPKCGRKLFRNPLRKIYKKTCSLDKSGWNSWILRLITIRRTVEKQTAKTIKNAYFGVLELKVICILYTFLSFPNSPQSAHTTF